MPAASGKLKQLDNELPDVCSRPDPTGQDETVDCVRCREAMSEHDARYHLTNGQIKAKMCATCKRFFHTECGKELPALPRTGDPRL
jgi:hypothetical protein